MIVDFIGCTGSGKTTLISAVQTRLAKTTPVITACELVTGLVGLQRVKHPTAQNVIQELVGFPFFVRSWRRTKPFLAYTTRLLSHREGLSLTFLLNLRSLERKIGVYEVSCQNQRDRIILVDEGPVLAAHMFAYDHTPMSDDEIDRFARLVPLPDLLVYVKAPVAVMVERTLNRDDRPRELRIKHQTQIEKTIQRTTDLFDRLVNAGNIRPRSIFVDNSDDQAQGKAVDDVVDFILKYQMENS